MIFNYTETALKFSIYQAYSRELLFLKYHAVVFGFGLVIFLGLVGNSYSFVIQLIIEKHSRSSATSLCIKYMTLSNLGSVVIGASNHWLSSLLTFSIREYSTWACQLHFFLTHLATENSIWFEIIFSIIRVVAVTWPLKVHIIFTKNFTGVCLIIVTILVILKNIGQSLSQGVVQLPWGRKCLFPIAYLGYVFSVLEFVTIVIIPYILYLSTSFIVLYKIAQSRKLHRSMMSTRFTASSRALKDVIADEESKGTTNLLFLNNFAFVLLYAPYMVYRVLESYLGLFHTQDPAEALFVDFIYRMANLFLYLHHAIYWLLLLTGKQYRRKFCLYLRLGINSDRVTGSHSGEFH